MASAISANKAELLAIANAVASEKMIDKTIVVEAMEEAIQKAARARYGAENDIRAKLDLQTGDLRLWRVVEVVEEVEDYFKQVDLKQADKLEKGSKVGDFIVDPLPAVDLGRIDAQSAKQVIFQKVRDAERERQFEEFKDRAGEIITGVVKSVEFGHVVVDLGRAEGVIRRDQQIPARSRSCRRPCPCADHECAPRKPWTTDFSVSRASRFHETACSLRKCLKFMTALSKSRPPPVIPEAAPKSA